MPTERQKSAVEVVSPSPTMGQKEAVKDLNRVLKSLDKLTPREIAFTLQKEGCVGTRRSPNACPVAQYLRSQLPWAVTIIVSPIMISAYPELGRYHDPQYPSAISNVNFQNVKNFINQFDEGDFPFLEFA